MFGIKRNERESFFIWHKNEDVQIKLFGRRLKGTKDILKVYKAVSIEITDEKFLAKGEKKFSRL